MPQATQFLTVGLPGTGKTTQARRIRVEQHAFRPTKDEWMKASTGSTIRPPTSSKDASSTSRCTLSNWAPASSSTTACGAGTSAPLSGKRRPRSIGVHVLVDDAGTVLKALADRPSPALGTPASPPIHDSLGAEVEDQQVGHGHWRHTLGEGLVYEVADEQRPGGAVAY